MPANEVATTRLPGSVGRESEGLTICSQIFQLFNVKQWCEVCLPSQSNWECVWNKMCRVYRNDIFNTWHSGTGCICQCVRSQGMGGPECAFPHTCVDTEALAAPGLQRSLTHSFAVFSAMASHTASAFSLAHPDVLAALSSEFNRNLSCWISHFRMLHRHFFFKSWSGNVFSCVYHGDLQRGGEVVFIQPSTLYIYI